MKKSIRISVLSLGAASLLAGCALFSPAVPTTKISGTIAGQSFSVSNPKDTAISNLTVKVRPNGQAELSIGSLASANNSNVINSAYAGQASVVKETGDAAVKAFQAGIQAAGQAAK